MLCNHFIQPDHNSTHSLTFVLADFHLCRNVVFLSYCHPFHFRKIVLLNQSIAWTLCMSYIIHFHSFLNMTHAFFVYRIFKKFLHGNVWLVLVEFPSSFIITWPFWRPLKHPVSDCWCWALHLCVCDGLPSHVAVHRAHSVIFTIWYWVKLKPLNWNKR